MGLRVRSLRAAAVVGLPIVLFTLPLAYGLTRDPNARSEALVGHAAPGFSLPLLGGSGDVSLDRLRGRVVVLNFWASWCSACREEHQALADAWTRFRPRGAALVGIAFEDREQDASRFVAELGEGWPHGIDPGDRIGMSYGVTGVPETVVIDPSGNVAARWVGPVTYDQLAAAIRGALKVAR
jgi:cytochrome c biogenesis protein CcmG/thiol:disulfide interchange protein DsbE